MKKRVLFLDQAEFIGGAECFLLDFFNQIDGIERSTIDPVILGGKSDQYQKKVPNQIPIIPFNYPPVRGNNIQKLFHVFRLLWAARKIASLARKQKVSHFFTNTPRTHFAMFLAKKIWRVKGPWVAYFHDFTVPSFLIKKISHKADILVANSIPTRKMLRESIPSKYYSKIRIIENGIDTSKVSSPPAPKNFTKVLVIGRIDPKKGQMEALEAAEILMKSNPELQFKIVGDINPYDNRTIEYFKQIKEFSEHHELMNVEFSAAVADPLAEIAKHDIVLMLSTEPETFGRVVIESLLMNRLLLSFDQVGPREVLQSYRQYICKKQNTSPYEMDLWPSHIVKVSNSKDLAEKIAYFASHPEDAERYTRNAESFVRENYDINQTITNMMQLFQTKY